MSIIRITIHISFRILRLIYNKESGTRLLSPVPVISHPLKQEVLNWLSKIAEMMKIVVFAMLFFCLSRSECAAAQQNRTILALYDSSEHAHFEENLIYKNLEVIFDHLGLLLDYHDIRLGLPSHHEMSGYRGIVTWYMDNRMNDPGTYVQWLKKECIQGRFVTVFGPIGALEDDSGLLTAFDTVVEVYRLWGVKFENILISNPLLLKIKEHDSEFFSFERSLKTKYGEEVSVYKQFTMLNHEHVDPILTLNCSILKKPDSVVAAFHPYGGYVMREYAIYTNPVTFNRQWYLNPFRFLQRAFRWKNAPCADVTTLNGCRIYYSHIDGDGSISLSGIDRKSLTSEIIYNRLLQQINLPVTVSVVEGEIATATTHPWIQDKSRVVNTFRKIFRLENIEPGAHGYSHPLHWTNGITAININNYTYQPTSQKEIKSLSDRGYKKGVMMSHPKNQWERREILGSIDYINKNLLPANKKCNLFQWTGNCLPDSSALAVIDENHLLNINGGDSRYDSRWASYTGLSPSVRQLPNSIQVHTSASNENLYTNLWTRNFSGFRNVIKTFENTGYPKRIKPINIYYHFYSAEKKASFNALKDVYKYCHSLELAPLFTSTYVKTVLNSRSIIFDLMNDKWSWENALHCRTLRWDSKLLFPDLANSKGVIGFYHDPKLNSLFIHLDGSGTGSLSFSKFPPEICYLSRATGYVNNWHTTTKDVQFDFIGNGSSWVEFAGLAPNSSYKCSLDSSQSSYNSSEEGLLRIELKTKPFVKNVHVRLLLK